MLQTVTDTPTTPTPAPPPAKTGGPDKPDVPETPESEGSDAAKTVPSDKAGAKEPQTAKEAIKAGEAAMKKWLLKDGEINQEVTEEELVKLAHKGFGAERRYKEAAQIKKQFDGIVSMLKDPRLVWEVLKHPSIGHDPKKLAEEFMWGIVQKELMTPEQRELAEAKERLQKFEEEKKKSEQEAQTRQMKELEQRFSADYEGKIISTLEKSGLPKTRRTVSRMAHYMLQGLKQGVKLDPADVVDIVKQDYTEDVKGLFGGLEGEKLFEVLGEDVAKKIRKFDLERVATPAGTATPTPNGSGPSSSSAHNGKALSKDEWRERNERIKQGLE